MARRKAIYLELYPETGHGGDRKSQSAKNQDDTVSFCSDTAAKTHQSKRTVERHVEIGEALSKLQNEIRADKIRDKLNWQRGILNSLGCKPKGMHWKTYQRLTAEHDDYANKALLGMHAKLEIMTNRVSALCS